MSKSYIEMKREAELWVQRQVALEREQMRQRDEIVRMVERQDKLEREQMRQAEQIAKLEQKVALAEREINHYKPLLDSLREQERQLDNKVWYLTDRGLPCAGIQKTLDQVRERAYKIETKILKAEFDRDNARMKM